MKQHGILFEDDYWNSRQCAQFKAHVEEIVDPERLSAPQPKSVKRFRDGYKWTSAQNESTFFNWILPKIVTETFQPNIHSAQVMASYCNEDPFTATRVEHEEPTNEVDIEERFNIGQGMILDRLLLQGFLPNAFEDQGFERLMAKHLQKGRGFATPKPDALLGFRNDFLLGSGENLELDGRINELLNIAPGLHHPYLLMEGKSKDGTVRELELQARRGGATLVRSARELREYAYNDGNVSKRDSDSHAEKERNSIAATTNSLFRPPDTSPDFSTFIFSSITTTQAHTIYVHFAEVSTNGKIVRYHMNWVREMLCRSSSALSEARRWSGNISDWGLLNRRKELEEMRTKLFEREKDRTREVREQKRQSKTPTAQGDEVEKKKKSSPRKRQRGP